MGSMPGQTRRWRGGRHWDLRFLVLAHAAAAGLVASWMAAATGPLWDELDDVVFVVLNGLIDLGEGDGWAAFWAWTNTRAFDRLSGGVMIVVLAVFVLLRPTRWRQRLASAAFVGIYLLAVVGVCRHALYGHIPERPSPTLVHEQYHALSERAPHIEAKETSSSSFPSDHGIVLIVYTAVLWALAGWRFGLVAAVLAALFVAPRLVGGAHWFTDVVVGSAALALIASAWAVATPLHRRGRAVLLRSIHALSLWVVRWVPALRPRHMRG